MTQMLNRTQVAAMMGARHGVPLRRWHVRGYRISIWSSLLAALAIGLFFIANAGWSPADASMVTADVSVTWLVLSYIWLQMGSLILVGAGTKHQMWIDALTSMVPLFLIVYVILQHHTGFVPLSGFQIRTAWILAYGLLLDVVVDLGISVLLSRQVVEIGDTGVG
jgi:hypothetical protein